MCLVIPADQSYNIFKYIKKVKIVKTKSFSTVLIIIAKIRRNFNVHMIEQENQIASGYSSIRMKTIASRKHLLNIKDNTILYVFRRANL